MDNAPPIKLTLPDQVLINALGVVLTLQQINPDDRTAPIEAMRKVLPYVSRERALMNELADCAAEICRLWPDDRCAEWTRAAFTTSDVLGQVLRLRMDGALAAWSQQGA